MGSSCHQLSTAAVSITKSKSNESELAGAVSEAGPVSDTCPGQRHVSDTCHVETVDSSGYSSSSEAPNSVTGGQLSTRLVIFTLVRFFYIFPHIFQGAAALLGPGVRPRDVSSPQSHRQPQESEPNLADSAEVSHIYCTSSVL